MTVLASAVAESGLFDTIGDLPLHPLIVHVAVVILPLSALALLVLLVVPRWRGTFGWLTMGGLAIGLVGAFAAKESGEALAARIGLPPDHARLGDILPLFAFGLFVLSLAWFLLDRRARARGQRSTGVTVLGIVAGLAAVATIVLTVLVGHSGAKATWAWKIAPAAASDSSASSEATTPAPAASGALTLADVQAHGTPSDCWSAINGNVYDLTDWIGQHPGGARDIERICGTDGSSDFNGQHQGQREPEQDLGRFLLGPLQSASAGAPMALTVTNAAFVTTAAAAPAALPSAKKYTRAQVRKHSTASDCWSIINRKVYNLTTWIRQHPGGASRILAICGKDGSAAFNAQHAGQSRPAADLRRFQIGVLR